MVVDSIADGSNTAKDSLFDAISAVIFAVEGYDKNDEPGKNFNNQLRIQNSDASRDILGRWLYKTLLPS